VNARRPEVADVIRDYGEAYVGSHSTSSLQRRVLTDLGICRTAVLGGHQLRCDRCDHEEISYNSCRNRHCPKCQAMARAAWLDQRRQDLIPTPYFHVVFTLPDDIGPLVLQNKAELYGLLFRAAARSLQEIAADEKHLGAQLGFLTVLHTWGQTLRYHPHVHCVVPGGGISVDGSSWVPCADRFFLPVRALSWLFRGKYLAGLEALRQSGELEMCGSLKRLRGAEAWQDLRQALFAKDWVVYIKPPFGGPEQVLKYLARYTHRVAISNGRLLSAADGKISFRWKDYAHGNAKRAMTLSAPEFIRRFLLHVLPKGFVRIRHYGFLSNRVRKQKLELVRELVASSGAGPEYVPPSSSKDPTGSEDQPLPSHPCPACKEGRLVVVAELSEGGLLRHARRSRAPP